MANPLKNLAIKSFRITHPIHKGQASLLAKNFSSSVFANLHDVRLPI